jgi:lysophospholipase L1-like esterase
MKAIMLMFDSLNRNLLSPYGCEWTKTPNFKRLSENAVTFDTCYAGSLPCMPARRELHTGRYNFLVLDLEPEKLFLLIGTNDLGKGVSVEDATENIKKICMKIVTGCPKTKIYLISVCPVDNSRETGYTLQGPKLRTNEAIKRLNQIIQKYSGLIANLEFLDVYNLLANDHGDIQKAYSIDGIHLSIEGYRLLTNFLNPYLSE